jgi:hypothetical protein
MYFSYSLIENLLFYIIIVQIYLDFCQEKVEDTRALIRSRKSKMDRQYNSQKNKNERTTNDLQTTTQKIKDRAIRTPIKTDGELRLIFFLFLLFFRKDGSINDLVFVNYMFSRICTRLLKCQLLLQPK